MDLKAPLRATLLFHRRTEGESPEEWPLGAGLVVALGAVRGLCCCWGGSGCIPTRSVVCGCFLWDRGGEMIPIALRHRPGG